eukprot:64535_1
MQHSTINPRQMSHLSVLVLLIVKTVNSISNEISQITWTNYSMVLPSPKCSQMAFYDSNNNLLWLIGMLFLKLSHSLFFHRPRWDMSQSPTNNIKYNGGAWTINNGENSLIFLTKNLFPPINNYDTIWYHSSASGAFSAHLTCIESYYPTPTPTIIPGVTSTVMVSQFETFAQSTLNTDNVSMHISENVMDMNLMALITVILSLMLFGLCLLIFILIFYRKKESKNNDVEMERKVHEMVNLIKMKRNVKLPMEGNGVNAQEWAISTEITNATDTLGE